VKFELNSSQPKFPSYQVAFLIGCAYSTFFSNCILAKYLDKWIKIYVSTWVFILSAIKNKN